MEQVVLDGVTYTKASVAAKQFRYTSDYIGQLCRAKKIDARLVGRTWFVNTDTIEAHQSTKYQNLRGQESVGDTNDTEEQSIDVPVRAVEPVLKTKTLKQLASPLHATERSLEVAYDVDSESLLPELHKAALQDPVELPVTPAESKRIKIHGVRKETDFTPTELPEVSLQGDLKVTDIPDIETQDDAVEEKDLHTHTTSDIASKNIDISDKLPQHVEHKAPSDAVPSSKRLHVAMTRNPNLHITKLTPKATVRPAESESAATPQVQKDAVKSNVPAVSSQPQKSAKAIASVPSPDIFVPKAVQASAMAKKMASTAEVTGIGPKVLLAGTVSASLVLALLFIGTSAELIVVENSQAAQLQFDTAKLLEVWVQIKQFFIHS